MKMRNWNKLDWAYMTYDLYDELRRDLDITRVSEQYIADANKELRSAVDTNADMLTEAYFSIRDQLHRVARERDEERDSRLAAEAALADCLEEE